MRYTGLTGIVIILVLLWVPVVPAQKVQWSGNGHYYEAVYVPNGIYWDEANAQAKAAGGHLVTITSEAENDFVYSLISDDTFWHNEPTPTGPWGIGPWLGATKVNGDFAWVTGEPFSYTNWVRGEPDNYGGKENYIIFTAYETQKASTWDDVWSPASDWKPTGYIIEWDRNEPPPTAPWGIRASLTLPGIYNMQAAFLLHWERGGSRIPRPSGRG
jgi:hypothetical protein